MNIGKLTLCERSGWRHFCAAFLFCAAAAIGSTAQTLTTMVQFDETNGQEPNGLIQGFDGNFYGTTLSGGTRSGFGVGTIFILSRAGSLSTLYNFCTTSCNDGDDPEAGVIQANDGNFYGTTSGGGTSGACNGGCGTIYRLTPKGKETTLHSFASLDGSFSQAGLIQAVDGTFYGTTASGGAKCNGFVPCYGTVFKITPGGKLTTLHSFCLKIGCTDGLNPSAGLVQATNGNFYGTTPSGGNANSGGTIFQITPSGKFATIYSFCSQTNCADGSSPGGPMLAADGNLYGTTGAGGTNGKGTVFQITPTGILTTLYSFCSQTNCPDGSAPVGLIQATDGNFYGTTTSGGANCAPTGCGTIFSLTPTGTLTTLYSFCAETNCTDGIEPTVAFMQATDGNFYGTTLAGGLDICFEEFSCGTVFRLSTALGPFVKLTQDSGKVGQIGGILGQGFTGTTGVFLNGTPASFTVVSDTFIEATVPSGATSGFVTVNTPSGTLTSNVPFRVTP